MGERQPWTPELVLAATVACFARRPTLVSKSVGCDADEGDPWARFAARLITISAEVLGADSLACLALLTRARRLGCGGSSISEICRERVGWPRSRAALYRHSAAGLDCLAEALNRRRVAIPQELSSALAGETEAAPS